MATIPKPDDETRPLLNGPKLNGIPPPNDHELALLDEPSNWECFKVMIGVWLSTFLAALDLTIVATLSTAISDSFNALSLLSWVASAYIIATAVTQPVSGKLTDIYGRRAGFMLSIALFTAGNVICALAQTPVVMIFGRVIAGLGGGCLNTISTFVASDMIPLRRRGLWQGVGNVIFGLGLALGGVFGGVINDIAGWRWAFWFQVPLSTLCMIQVWFTLKIPVKESKGSKLRRVDFLGSCTLCTALVLLLIALNSGGNTVPWAHPLVLVSLPLSLLFLIAFVFIELRVPEPIIPMKQLSVRTVLAACLANWFGSQVFFSLMFYIPIYFQVRGDSTSAAGIKMIPISMGTGTGSLVVGFIMQIWGRYYWLNVGVMALFLAAYAAQTALQLDTPLLPVMIENFFAAFGQSGLITITLTAFVAAVDHEFHSVITAASYAFRSTGASIGVTISSAVFHHVVSTRLWAELGDRDEANAIIPRVLDRLDYARSLDPSWQEPVLEIYMDALRSVFLTMFYMAAMAAFCTLFMREHKLHTNLARRNST